MQIRDFAYGFCTKEGAGVVETITIGDYFEMTRQKDAAVTAPAGLRREADEKKITQENIAQEAQPVNGGKQIDNLFAALDQDKEQKVEKPPVVEAADTVHQESKSIYVREKKVDAKSRAEDVITKGRFLLKFVEKANPDKISGSLESSFFRGSAGAMVLGQLRSHIVPM